MYIVAVLFCLYIVSQTGFCLERKCCRTVCHGRVVPLLSNTNQYGQVKGVRAEPAAKQVFRNECTIPNGFVQDWSPSQAAVHAATRVRMYPRAPWHTGKPYRPDDAQNEGEEEEEQPDEGGDDPEEQVDDGTTVLTADGTTMLKPTWKSPPVAKRFYMKGTKMYVAPRGSAGEAIGSKPKLVKEVADLEIPEDDEQEEQVGQKRKWPRPPAYPPPKSVKSSAPADNTQVVWPAHLNKPPPPVKPAGVHVKPAGVQVWKITKALMNVNKGKGKAKKTWDDTIDEETEGIAAAVEPVDDTGVTIVVIVVSFFFIKKEIDSSLPIVHMYKPNCYVTEVYLWMCTRDHAVQRRYLEWVKVSINRTR